MASKRPMAETEAAPASDPKKPRHGFRVGPDNLPDGPWRRKNEKRKKELIHKAKLKKAYAKLKTQHEHEHQEAGGAEKPGDSGSGAEEPQLHPQRQAMLDEPEPELGAAGAISAPRDRRDHHHHHHRRQHRPDYFAKEVDQAARRQEAAAARADERRRRDEERAAAVARRQRFRKGMAKAGVGAGAGATGPRKLGRESGLLLEKVRKMVGHPK